jgi:Uma2 family endonuclease
MPVATPLPEVRHRQRRITVDEYHRMIEAGILDEDEHVQLIDGFLIAMTPQGEPHAQVIQRLNRLLVRSVGEGLVVRPQLPLTLGDSEPEPDLAVVREADLSRDRHPGAALLVVEVAADSLRVDRGAKAVLYARAGIPEYWIVSLEDSTVEVLRDPDASAGAYRARVVLAVGESVTTPSVPGLAVDVAGLFR